MDMDTTAQMGAQTFKVGVEQGKAAIEQAAAAGREHVKSTVDKSLAALNDMNAQSTRNVEAFVASVTAATKGAEALGAQAMSYAKSNLEKQMEAAKAMSTARSVQELVELQASFAKSAVEGYIAEMNKASETVASAVKDAMRPLNERAAAAMESMQSVR